VQIEYLDQGTSGYRAGACNIGPKEIARRRRAGIAAIVIAVGLGVVLVAIDAPALLRGLVLLPLWGGLVSLEQVRRKFCVAFAYAGIRGTNPTETRESVVDAADLAADRAAARWMVTYCGLIALVVTGVFVALPT
jgi:hypothetical protein